MALLVEQQDELQPQIGLDVIAVGRVEAGFLAQAQEGVAAGAAAPGQFAEDQPHEASGLADDSRGRDGGADLRDPAHHRPGAEYRNQTVGGVDAVLQRDHRGGRPDKRLDGGPGGLDVPQLDAEQDEVERDRWWRGHPSRAVGLKIVSPRPPSMRRPLARMAFKWAPRATKVTSAPAVCKRGSKGAADASGADDGYAHGWGSVVVAEQDGREPGDGKRRVRKRAPRLKRLAVLPKKRRCPQAPPSLEKTSGGHDVPPVRAASKERMP